MVRVEINKVKLGRLPDRLLDGKSHALKLDRKAEAFSHQTCQFAALHAETTNPLIAAVYTAFADHLPLELGPDIIFNTILQGISKHVSTNPEHFRNVFVAHDGKKQLISRDDSLIKGNWNNNWEASILDLGRQIKADMSGEQAKQVIDTTFTTTTLAEQTAHTAVFMDIVKAYYEYTGVTRCGIPWIEITGTREDWVLLQRTIEPLLLALKLTNWNVELQEIISHFVRAFDGDFDFDHWNRIYNYHGPQGSGGVSKVSGWIAKLFLYVKDDINPLIGKPDEDVPIFQVLQTDPTLAHTPWLDESLWRSSTIMKPPTVKPATAIKLADFPCGTTKTEFTWICYDRSIKMDLIAGLVGITLTEKGSLKPEVGWLIAEQ